MTLPDPIRITAFRLGLLGLVPFAGLAVASLAGGDDLRVVANPALLAYGATILSFLGGIHWGLVLARPLLSPRETLVMLGVGVLPQLLGWVALIVPAPLGHMLCAGGLVLFLAADRAAVSRGLAPAWFMQLRWPLSCGAALAMLAGAVTA
jgi:hypothetical protein